MARTVLNLLLVVGVTAYASSTLADDAKGGGAKSGAQDADFGGTVTSFLGRYCISCHGGAKPKGSLALDVYRDEKSFRQADATVWRKVVGNLRSGEMPPAKRRLRPTPAEVEAITAGLEARLLASSGKKDPGRVTLRRLNCVEYNNTIRDLVGVDFQPADDFPADDVGYGFDNIGDVLSMPPILLEKYLSAADRIVAAAFRNPDTRKRIIICQPTKETEATCIRKIVEAFAARAYRRPLASEEVDRLARLTAVARENGDGFEAGIQVALKAVLVSPHFLFRVELDNKPSDPNAVHPVTDYELASRLSYFLWSSMPDDELFARARQNTLRGKEVLESEVRRMLNDPKSKAFVENFAGQWLQTRNLKTSTPDPARFPDFDDGMRAAMQKETELFFQTIVKEDRSILDFLDGRFSFVNERLARHYGITGVKGTAFQRVQLTGDRRAGVLTQGSVLTVTSNPTRTSPVKRGKWILENILGAPPPPPPPGAGELSESKKAVDAGSLRQRMEQHRADPNCASCHQRMDPLGFGLENFDATGAWRERDGKFPIDACGVLPGGKSFKGPEELRTILKSKSSAFCRCLTEKMLTYALGRGLESYDQPAVDQICAALGADKFRFSRLVIEIVNSDPFQKRRGKRGT
jgi:mono/diheme cytochrome c family protein